MGIVPQLARVNGNPQRSLELTIPASELDDRRHDDLLSAISDPACRTILHATATRELTASELAGLLDLPLSTVYRKLNRLTTTPLVEETYRLPTAGNNSRQYRCVVSQIDITITEPEGPVSQLGSGSAPTPAMGPNRE